MLLTCEVCGEVFYSTNTKFSPVCEDCSGSVEDKVTLKKFKTESSDTRKRNKIKRVSTKSLPNQ